MAVGITPDTLSIAARRLYEQFEHLEPDDGSAPWAAVCAALAAPIDPIYDLVAGGERPWSPALDVDEAAEVLTPEFALAVIRWLGQFAGLTLAESLNLLQQRITITESSAAKRGNPDAIKAAVRAVLVGPDETPDTATVYLTERIGDDPYVFAVATLNAETPDPSAVERVLLDRVGEPNGARQWTVTVIAGGTYAVLKAVHATYSEVKTDFATYADVRADPSVT